MPDTGDVYFSLCFMFTPTQRYILTISLITQTLYQLDLVEPTIRYLTNGSNNSNQFQVCALRLASLLHIKYL